MKTSQKGFAVLETLLILVIIAMIAGTGWYTWHTKNQTDKILSEASNTAQTTKTVKTTSTQSQNYVTITEWGVRAPYGGSDTFSYTLASGDSNSALFVSKNLAQMYGCTGFGAGEVGRFSSSDDASLNDPSVAQGTTAAQDASQNPGKYTHIGNYYYLFTHDQAACSDSVTVDAQNSANDAVKSIVANLQAIPE